MARKAGQMVARGASTWLVRVYPGRDPQSGTRKYLNPIIHGPFLEALKYCLPRHHGPRIRAIDAICGSMTQPAPVY
jgi:hypothetical protein